MKLDATQLIDDAIAMLHKAYVFPDVVPKIEKRLRDHVKAKRYDKIKSAEKLAKTLTEDLQAVSHDKHLQVVFSEQPLPADPPADFKPSADQQSEMRAHAAKFNAAFVKVERLAGNIGYLRLDAFLPPFISASRAAAAMTFLADTDELIIDLRNNGGGDPEAVAMLVGYLYDGSKAQHVNDIYWRADESTQQFWTPSDLSGHRYPDKPVYVLTSARTFSAAEDFAYGVKMLGRAKVVGEVTGGGAHPSTFRRLTANFGIVVPNARSINPISKTNWEGVGVKPHVKADETAALDTAYVAALRSQRKRLGAPKSREHHNLTEEVATALEKLERKLGGKRKRR